MSFNIVNWKQLHDISGGDVNFERELIELFRQGFESSIAKFEEAFRTSDIKGCIQWSHDIKGSSRNIGADLIGYYSERMEHLSREGKPLEAAQFVAPLREVYQQTLATFVEYFSKQH